MSAFTDALTRLSTGAPTGYNNGDYNASTNPYGFGAGGHRTNLYALTADVTLVTNTLIASVDPVSDQLDDIAALAAITGNITTLAALSSQIASLASISSALSALAAIAANISAVAGITANVTIVAGIATPVSTVAGISSNVTAVAGALANIATVVSMAANIAALAPRAADIGLLADLEDGTIATGALHDIAANLTPIANVAASIAGVNSVAGALSAINTVAGISTAVTAVSGNNANVSTVAANIVAVNTVSTNIADVLAAAGNAAAAAASAVSAASQAAALSGTSTSSITIGTGSKAFTTQASKQWQVGYWLMVVSAGNPTVNWMFGQITSYSGTALVVNVTVVGGSGAHTDWGIGISGPQGAAAAGTGDFVGIGSSVAHHFVGFGDTSGKLGEDSGVGPSDLFLLATNDLDDITDGSSFVKMTTAERSKLTAVEALADVTDAGNVGSSINGASAKTTPVDADVFAMLDSAASNVLKKITWANIKATLKSYFDTLYSAIGHTHTFASLTSKPTTMAGYGIIDAKPAVVRLTLSTGVAFPETDLVAQTTIYVTLVEGSLLEVIESGHLTSHPFTTDLSVPLRTGDHLSGSIYPLGVFWDGSAWQAGTGPAWTNSTTPSAAIVMFGGIPVNNASMTVKYGASSSTTVAAHEFHYLGDFKATANGQATDSVLKRLLYNDACKDDRSLLMQVSTSSWNYSLATYQQANNDAANQVEVLNGRGGSVTHLTAQGLMSNSTSTYRVALVGVGIDSSTVNSAGTYPSAFGNDADFAEPHAEFKGYVGQGAHVLKLIERGHGSDTQTFRGSNAGGNAWRTGLVGSHEC